MADQNIALGVQVPDAMKSISGMLNFANQAQQLRTSQQEYQRGSLGLEKERALLQPGIEQGIAESEKAKTGATSAAFKLEGDQSAKAMQIASGLVQDPRISKSDPIGTIDAANEAYSQMVANGVPKTTADFWASQIKAKAHQPGAALQLLQNVTRSTAGAGTTAGVINAPLTMVDTPAGTKAPMQLQPGAAGAVSPVSIESLNGGTPAAAPGTIPAGIPPSGLQTQASDALGRPVIAEKDQRGTISYKPPPGSNYKPMMTLPTGETAETAKPLFALRDQAQAEAAAAPEQHFNNQQILRLAPEAFTGTGIQALVKIANAWGGNFDAGVSTSQLQHFIARQTVKNGQAAGADTDAARRTVANAVQPGDSPQKAIQAITKVNDAFVTGVEAKNQGLGAALNHPSNDKDIFAVRDFQNAWSRNFDPRIMMLENAATSGDKEEVTRIQKELGKDGMAALRKKAWNLKSLTETGRPVNGL